MPTTTSRGADLYYETSGDGETVAFVPDLGCGPWLWSWQAPALGGFETLVWDPPGCGRSGDPGAYAIEAMAGDLEAVLSDAGVRSSALVGAGLGGTIALAYARTYARADRLALLGTPLDGARFDASAFRGTDPGDLLSTAFQDAYPDEVDRIAGWRREEDAPESVKAAQADAVAAFDASEWCHEVTVPALVAHGEADEVVPVGAGTRLAEALPRGEFDAFEDGSHFFFVEQSRLVTDRLAGFLESG